MTRDVTPSLLGLRNVRLLEGLPEPALQRLALACAWRRYDAGQHVLTRDAVDRSVHLIVGGRIRVTTYSSAGREVIFHDLGQGEHFGEFAALDGKPRSADAVAVASSVVASVGPDAFLALQAAHPIVAERVQLRLVALIRTLTDRVVDLSTASVSRRVAAELLRQAVVSTDAPNVGVVDPAPRHAELAARVSTYREQVTRELSALARAGVIARSHHSIRIVDLRALHRIADGIPPAV